VGLAALAIWQHWIEIPDAWSPLATLRIDEETQSPHALQAVRASPATADSAATCSPLPT
jgi:hypothetical protein